MRAPCRCALACRSLGIGDLGKAREVGALLALGDGTTQPRARKEPSVTIRLSRSALEQLRSSNEGNFNKLVDLVLELVPNRTVQTMRVPKEVARAAREFDTDSLDSIATGQMPRTRAPAPAPAPAPRVTRAREANETIAQRVSRRRR